MAVKKLDVKGPQISHINEDPHPFDIDHPSIFQIKQYFKEPTDFNFSEVVQNEIKKEIKNLDSSKKSTFKNITLQSLKEAQDMCSPLLYDIWVEEIVRKETFPKDLKNVDITPVFFKKNNPLLTKNYRPVSVLPNI